MKNTILEKLIKYLLSVFHGVTTEQWTKAKELVLKAAAELKDKPGNERRQWVIDQLKSLWGDLAPWLLNLLVDNAFGLLLGTTKK